MNKKMLAAIAVVIIVIVAGVAVYYLLKEGDGDKAQLPAEWRDGYERTGGSAA